MAVVLVDYLLQVEVNPRKALELCSEATQKANYKSWFWKRNNSFKFARLPKDAGMFPA